MSKDEGIPWELLKIEVPEGVPKETGFFEITGTATSEKVSSRVYAWFLDIPNSTPKRIFPVDWWGFCSS